jgi:hypothetical protein
LPFSRNRPIRTADQDSPLFCCGHCGCEIADIFIPSHLRPLSLPAQPTAAPAKLTMKMIAVMTADQVIIA